MYSCLYLAEEPTEVQKLAHSPTVRKELTEAKRSSDCPGSSRSPVTSSGCCSEIVFFLFLISKSRHLPSRSLNWVLPLTRSPQRSSAASINALCSFRPLLMAQFGIFFL